MERNFLKIVEPFDVVEIAYVARKMDLPQEEVRFQGRIESADRAEIIADDFG